MDNSPLRMLEGATFRRRVEKAPAGDGLKDTIDLMLQVRFVTLTGEQTLKLIDILDRAAEEVQALVEW